MQVLFFYWWISSSLLVFSVVEILNIYTKPPECVGIICRNHEIFTAGALEARVLRMRAFRAPAGKTE